MTEDLDTLVRDAASAPGARRTRAAARLMSLVEAQPWRLPELLARGPEGGWPQPRMVLGVTGAPGSGKSTLVDALVQEFLAADPERRIGVVAVDPSSPFTGGAVLGDRVRMMRHSTDPRIFIRSLATRGHLGGLSLGVKGVLRVLGLAGCEIVLVETVGVGQSEVEVARVADRVAVILAPGAGDAIQMLKAGLMEVGDLFVVNKADHDGADALHRTLLQTLQLAAEVGARPRRNGDRPARGSDAHGAGADAGAGPRDGGGSAPDVPRVALVSATVGTGIPELATSLRDLMDRHADRWRTRRRDAVRDDVEAAVLEAARTHLRDAIARDPALLDAVLEGRTSVEATAGSLLRHAPDAPDAPEGDQP